MRRLVSKKVQLFIIENYFKEKYGEKLKLIKQDKDGDLWFKIKEGYNKGGGFCEGKGKE